ncbi:hypothetical protein CVT25_006937 [Psilocybe cyanescens]|uniref:CxC2-like cysteine cluster KDZ transposase-associated domain-containing protein n=1 Tax=Psilocybe cyanescens TaxID=93625 RepID=A0A409WYH4_PSICY|nr:hypothetical protein CVT25_006937 [Psilocybe cyanescens]
MDHFCFCNLELKAYAYQFYQLIHRMTTPISRTEIVNVYHEFRCMWLKKLRWARYGHKTEDPKNPPDGTLSLYCPTCPQPGINLPTNWKEDPNRLVYYTHYLIYHAPSTVYKHIFVTDRNFKADHVRQKCNDDIWLINGAGMVPNTDNYQQFLVSAIERVTKAPCENMFKAITNALLAPKACDKTGKVAFACAQHGCFVPNSLANLFRGEQQKNIDYALLQAIKSTHVEPEQGLLVIYDIVCAWILVLLLIKLSICFIFMATKTFVSFVLHQHSFLWLDKFLNHSGQASMQSPPWSGQQVWLTRKKCLMIMQLILIIKKMLRMTKVLSTKYMDAIVMVSHADAYFREISGDIVRVTLNEWEDEIQSVEAMWLANIQ